MTLREMLEKARQPTSKEQMDAADKMAWILEGHAEAFIELWEAAAHASCIRDRQGELLHPRLARAVEALRDLMEGNSE